MIKKESRESGKKIQNSDVVERRQRLCSEL